MRAGIIISAVAAVISGFQYLLVATDEAMQRNAWAAGMLTIFFFGFTGWFWSRRRLQRSTSKDTSRRLSLMSVTIAGITLISVAAVPIIHFSGNESNAGSANVTVTGPTSGDGWAAESAIHVISSDFPATTAYIRLTQPPVGASMNVLMVFERGKSTFCRSEKKVNWKVFKSHVQVVAHCDEFVPATELAKAVKVYVGPRVSRSTRAEELLGVYPPVPVETP
ncbi:hypothetical protein [Lysinibacter cavernae]|uniref:hypothetical protein n=1 Tax=Lysinibacter cavernae TaxID=1640652 RepID=UPI003609AFAD